MALPSIWQWQGQVTVLAERSENEFYFACKRCLDFVIAAISVVFLSPLLLLIAIAIKLDSRGPVFFTQERVGSRRERHGKKSVWAIQNFRIYKFRSMVQDADPSVHQAYIRDFVEGRAQPAEGAGGNFKLTGDSRVTRVGRCLRQSSLDELPQLFNVLKGEMSLVGPRPVPTYEVACYSDGDYERLAAWPGITGLWQVNGRCKVTFEEMIRMDIQYARAQSLWLDLKILARTIPAVVSGRGAE